MGGALCRGPATSEKDVKCATAAGLYPRSFRTCLPASLWLSRGDVGRKVRANSAGGGAKHSDSARPRRRLSFEHFLTEARRNARSSAAASSCRGMRQYDKMACTLLMSTSIDAVQLESRYCRHSALQLPYSAQHSPKTAYAQQVCSSKPSKCICIARGAAHCPLDQVVQTCTLGRCPCFHLGVAPHNLLLQAGPRWHVSSTPYLACILALLSPEWPAPLASWGPALVLRLPLADSPGCHLSASSAPRLPPLYGKTPGCH